LCHVAGKTWPLADPTQSPSAETTTFAVVKRVDSVSPVLYEALVESQPVTAHWKLQGASDAGVVGTFVRVDLEGGFIGSIEPLTWEGDPYERLLLSFQTATVEVMGHNAWPQSTFDVPWSP
jgi:type VI protein secretion system component Hcp